MRDGFPRKFDVSLNFTWLALEPRSRANICCEHQISLARDFYRVIVDEAEGRINYRA